MKLFTTLFSLTVLAIALLSCGPMAFAEEGVHSIGVQGGQVTLTNDWGSPYGNALGGGVLYRYAASDYLELELGWLNSKHNSNANGSSISLNQNAFNVDVLYDFDVLDILVPYIKGGVDYVTHTQDVVGPFSNLYNQNYNGFGLNIGFGGDFLLSKRLTAGLDFTYHNIFTAQTTSLSATPVNVIGSYFTVMAHLLFRFGDASSTNPHKTF